VPAAAAACLVLVAASHAAPAKGAGERIAEKQATGIARALPAQTPPMGWNSWYALGGEDGWKTTDEQTIAEIADALVATGLAEAGYRTLVVDDSWSADVRQEGSGLQAHRLSQIYLDRAGSAIIIRPLLSFFDGVYAR
jgi:alpha-galactosidase